MQLTLTAGCRLIICTYFEKVTCPCKYYKFFIALPVDRYNNRLLPILRQFLLILNRINNFMDLNPNCSTALFNQFCWNLISTWRFVPFQPFNSQLKLKGTLLRH